MRELKRIDRRNGLLLVACLCMVVLGFLHTHDVDGSEHLSDSHFCFACSMASFVDVETGQQLPPVVECRALPAPEPTVVEHCPPTLTGFSARAPPAQLS